MVAQGKAEVAAQPVHLRNRDRRVLRLPDACFPEPRRGAGGRGEFGALGPGRGAGPGRFKLLAVRVAH